MTVTPQHKTAWLNLLTWHTPSGRTFAFDLFDRPNVFDPDPGCIFNQCCLRLIETSGQSTPAIHDDRRHEDHDPDRGRAKQQAAILAENLLSSDRLLDAPT